MNQETTMPVISIEMGPSTPEKKQKLIQALTTTAAQITGIPEQSFIVLIKEYPLDAIGVGGEPLSNRISS